MDFEAFKKDFERFSKIDTPEKFAICESQYQYYLLRQEDDKYFEPWAIIDDDGPISNYYKKIKQTFGLDDMQINELCFLIMPSFEPESLVILTKGSEDYSLTFIETEKNNWNLIFSNIPFFAKNKTIRAKLQIDLGGKLFEIFSNAINEARKPLAQTAVLDGTRYFLQRREKEGIKAVVKHSPSQNSRSGKIVEMFVLLAEYTKRLDAKYLDKIASHIENLEN